MKADVVKAMAKLAGLDRAVTPETSPIPCKGYEINTPDAHEFDCAYEHAGKFGCEDCVVNGGRFDPRTGRAYRKRKAKKEVRGG